jgi:hypothetical protein
MAHFDYIRPGGVWSLLSLLSSAAMAEIDRRIFKSINGDEGGVWAPTPTPIIIGGLGVQVTGPFEALNADITIPTGNFLTVELGGTVDCQVGSTVDILGTLLIGGTTTISGPVTINSGVAVTSEADIELTDGDLKITHPATLTIDGAATLLKTFLVGGGAAIGVANTGNITWQDGAIANHQLGSTTTFALGSNLTINGALTQSSGSVWTLNGTHSFGATAVVSFHVNSTVLFNNAPTLSSGMSVGYKYTKTNTFMDCLRYYEAPNVNTFINPWRDVVVIPGNLTTNKTYQIGNPLFSLAADECIIMRVIRKNSNDGTIATLVRADVGSTVIASLKSSDHLPGVTLIYSGTTERWDVLSYSGFDGIDVVVTNWP